LPADLTDGLRRIAHPAIPDPSLRQGGERALWRSTLRAVRQLLLRASLLSLLAAAIATGAAFVGMGILRADRSRAAMLGLAGAFLALNLAAQLVTFFSERLRLYVNLGAETHLVGLISAKLLRMSPRRRARHSSGNLKILITSDAKNVGTFLENCVRNLMPAIAALLIIAPVLVRLTGAAGLAGVGFMALILPVSALLTRIMTRYQDRAQGELDGVAAVTGEWVKNIRLIRFLSWGERIEGEIAGRVRAFTRESVGAHLLACLIFGLSLSWWMSSVALVAWVSRRSGRQLDAIPFFGSIWLITYLSNFFTHLPNTIRLYGAAKPSVRRIAELLAEEEQADAFVPAPSPPGIAARRPVRLHLEGVSYGEILSEIDATFELGRRTAIVGEVGAGKTTLLRLICGELPPTTGRIAVEFDDGSRHDLWIEAVYHRFRAQLAYVPQEPFVANDLLDANVALDDRIDEPRVVQALAWAELEADVAELPGRSRQEIGEGGVNLSGGQRQRLNLARAFHSGRPFLVLDDTLSAVDPQTERRLVDRLLAQPAGFALVTHRVGELSRLDRVLVMREGRIVEEGAPAQLAARADSHLNRVLRAYGDAEPGGENGRA
jgi:ABC-type multidrug transport system fused ATPase/permease subunit